MSYRHLDPDNIVRTIETLQQRIEQRFPGRGICKLCAELLAVAKEDRDRLSFARKPNFLIRLLVLLAVIGGGGLAVWVFLRASNMTVTDEAFDMIQGIEAIINIIALAGAAAWFLMNLEANWRREAVLKDLHELRSLAHVVDMHQLTKDPTVTAGEATPATPAHGLTEFELTRYLDYCSEMLSLTGKLAALYMQNMRDPVIIQTVNEIEDLTGNLSRKIWQKIMIIRQVAG